MKDKWLKFLFGWIVFVAIVQFVGLYVLTVAVLDAYARCR